MVVVVIVVVDVLGDPLDFICAVCRCFGWDFQELGGGRLLLCAVVLLGVLLVIGWKILGFAVVEGKGMKLL